MLEVKLHDIGEGMTEGEIVHYLVKEGDHVITDQPLVEVQTDKMVAELPSPTNGIIKEILVKTGETIQVGTTLLYLKVAETEEIEQTSTDKKDLKTPTVTQQKKEIITPFKRILTTPYTRKIARDNNVKIEDVLGTGPSGRVTEEDVYRHLNGETTQIASPNVKQVEIAKATRSESIPDEIPFRGIRKQIATKMTKSLFTIPHVTHFDEVDMTNLLELREELKSTGVEITVPAFFIKALVFALKDFPVFNAELNEKDEKIILKKDYHIGMATETADGLLVPVIHDADKKTLKGIHQEMERLGEKAKNRKLTAADMNNSTFTMSNVGPLGSIGATPIINYPETALIAFHKTKKMPVVSDENEIVIRQIMTLSMSFDHRVADGATAIAFTNRFASLIRHPYKLLLEMV